ncbi:hypothetical protein, partial [Mesorhizobium sp.]|uniref:hypothetical protein n=1 Tax=Mesorhizobium sp. TaxID=1871066 RepID=UPI00257F8B18
GQVALLKPSIPLMAITARLELALIRCLQLISTCSTVRQIASSSEQSAVSFPTVADARRPL